MKRLIFILLILGVIYFFTKNKETPIAFNSIESTSKTSINKTEYKTKTTPAENKSDKGSTTTTEWPKELVLCKENIHKVCHIMKKRIMLEAFHEFLTLNKRDYELENIDSERLTNNGSDSKSDDNDIKYCLETRASCASDDFIFPVYENKLLEFLNASEVAIYLEEFAAFKNRPFNFDETKERLLYKEKDYIEYKEDEL